MMWSSVVFEGNEPGGAANTAFLLLNFASQPSATFDRYLNASADFSRTRPDISISSNTAESILPEFDLR